MLFSSCTPKKIEIISTKDISVENIDLTKLSKKHIEVSKCIFNPYGLIPIVGLTLTSKSLEDLPTFDKLIDEALLKGQGDLIMDVRLDASQWAGELSLGIVICRGIEGDVVNTKEIQQK